MKSIEVQAAVRCQSFEEPERPQLLRFLEHEWADKGLAECKALVSESSFLEDDSAIDLPLPLRQQLRKRMLLISERYSEVTGEV